MLQHIDPAICRTYLSDFALMAPAVYLLTRIESDFGTNVLATVGQPGLFDAGECVEVDHDPSTHQLRVLGSRSFEEVQRTTDGKHYEVLLRSEAAPVGWPEAEAGSWQLKSARCDNLSRL